MANPIPCDLCDSPQAQFMLHNLETADVLGICVLCLPRFAEQLVSAMDAQAGAMPPAGVVEPEAGDMPADVAEPSPMPKSNGRRPKAAAKDATTKAPAAAEASDE